MSIYSSPLVSSKRTVFSLFKNHVRNAPKTTYATLVEIAKNGDGIVEIAKNSDRSKSLKDREIS